jgi:hypothetical protein
VPQYLSKFLPASLIGFPKPGQVFDPENDLFLGANWAAFSGDIISMGGFDPRFGPGSPLRATGQESEMMKKMRQAGYEFRFVDDAIVWHEVEPDRFCEEFMSARHFRNGVQAGLHIRIKSQLQQNRPDWKILATYHLKSFFLPGLRIVSKWFCSRETSAWFRFSAAHARGFLEGYYSPPLHEEAND